MKSKILRKLFKKNCKYCNNSGFVWISNHEARPCQKCDKWLKRFQVKK